MPPPPPARIQEFAVGTVLLVGSAAALGVTGILVYPIAYPIVYPLIAGELGVVRAEVNNLLSIFGLRRKPTGSAAAAAYSGVRFQKF